MAGGSRFPRRIIKTDVWIRHAPRVEPVEHALDEKLRGFLFIATRTPSEFPRVRRLDSEPYYARIALEPL